MYDKVYVKKSEEPRIWRGFLWRTN